MKSQWRALAAKVDAMSTRERLMIMLAMVAVTAFVMNIAVIDPQSSRIKSLSTRIVQQESELQALQMKIQAMQKQRESTESGTLARRDSVRREIAEIDETFKGMQSSLVQAQNMRAVLQDVLSRNARVQLMQMRTLPVTPLVDKGERSTKTDPPAAAAAKQPEAPAAAPAESKDGVVFKHGVELTVQGSYADLYDYLARLEKLPWRMFWSRATLNATDYPRLTMTITVYTLSLDKAWLVL